MPISWKQRSKNLKPQVILDKINESRLVKPDGTISYKGFGLSECLPALYSMLDFPPTEKDIDSSDLVWTALAQVKSQSLTKEEFLYAINNELNKRLARPEQEYLLLTAISLYVQGLPKKINLLGTEIRFYSYNYPYRFRRPRQAFLDNQIITLPFTADQYSKVIIKTKARSASGAVEKSLRALDLQRAIWCLMANPVMTLFESNDQYSPINTIRLGSSHTLHSDIGRVESQNIWYDPNYQIVKVYGFKKPDQVVKNSRYYLRQIAVADSRYATVIRDALVRYVRAFDERDPNTAFLRLWSALEALLSPNFAEQMKLVQRCSALFKEREYYTQLLEHLREYRNTNVHAGEQSERAKTHCYQLQFFFHVLIDFLIRNAKEFRTLDEALAFLDYPTDIELLKRRVFMMGKRIKSLSAR
ncbi:hypothetical protein EV681_4598 [Advenella incenata]|uniref:Uncharacterized protein n=1 Tax=Advenella incenata TaxID=267800 RepID=A0A4Q7V4E0_9BURK|nr:HEPN domain-containing protein [Advenella incenata]RZT91075.1 hypothetical protein EV681_4598 [Advenella incenata]